MHKSSGASSSTFAAAGALSDHIDTRTAATELSHILSEDEQLEEGIDVGIVFGSFHHRAGLADACDHLRQTLELDNIIGVTAESVLGGSRELEKRAGLAMLALRLPDIHVHPFHLQPGQVDVRPDRPDSTQELIGYNDKLRAVMLLADPFSTPMTQVLRMIESCGNENETIPIAGGMASGASRPQCNSLCLNDHEASDGLVGLSFSGPIEIDCLVSQGCRPIGEPLVVTAADEIIVRELGGRPALEVVQEIAESLSERERELLTRGLLIGTVIDEYKDRFGRGDFLIRAVNGFDRERGAMRVSEPVRVGRTIQLHVRDAETASEDLELLLDLQELKGQPFAGALFTCNGRGSRLFNSPNHDIAAFQRRFENLAVAGMFAAGEIGPIGDRTFVHGHTASAMLFRKPG